jgi:RNA polymerase sigma factor (sigma-70 family)
MYAVVEVMIMVNGQLDAVLRHVQRIAGVADVRELSDAQLLERFSRERDEGAFAVLVRRHGPLVLGVCGRVLRQVEDVEDVFQATFLVLARKAGKLPWRESVSSWLHEVALRLALKTRAALACRAEKERKAADMSSRPAVRKADLHDVSAVLDEELRKLPERDRTPLLLCYLEGQGRDQAAAQLGCSRRTLQRRLDEGLSKLRERVSRRGVTVSAALVAGAITQPAVAAQLSLLAAKTVKAAALFATVQAGAAVTGCSREGLALAESMVRTMAVKKVGLIVALALSLGLAAGSGLWAGYASLAEPAHDAAFPHPEAALQPADTRAETPQKEIPTGVDLYGDPLPKAALARMGTVRLRHGGPVDTVAFSPDRKLLASGGHDNAVRLWDVTSGKEVRRLTATRGPGSENCWVHAVAFSRDGKYLAAGLGNGDHGIVVWELASGTEILRLQGHSGPVRGLAYMPDGKRLVSAGSEGTIIFWDLDTGKRLDTLAGKQTSVRSFAMSADGNRAATGGDEESVHLWDLAAGKELHQFGGHQQSVNALAFSRDGKTVATGDWTGNVRLGSVANGKQLRQWSAHDRSAVLALQFFADGKTLASASDSIRLWDVADDKQRRQFHGHWGPVGALAISADEKTIASGSWDATVRLWDVDKARVVGRNDGPPVIPPGTAAVRAHLLGAGQPERIRTGGHQHAVFSVAVSPDGKLLASTGQTMSAAQGEGLVRLWEIDSGKQYGEFQANFAGNLAFSPDGKTLVGACNEMHLWDVTSRKLLVSPLHFRSSHAIFSSDGKTLIEGTGDGKINVWQPPAGKKTRSFQAHKEWVIGMALSWDLNLLATCTQDQKGEVVLWDLATGREVRRLKTANNYVRALAFASDGRTLVSAGFDTRIFQGGSLQFWDAVTGTERRRIANVSACVGFSRDGRSVAASAGNAILVWEVATGQERCRFEGHQGTVSSLAFTPDGRRLCSGSYDTTVLVWDVTGLPQSGKPAEPQITAKQLDALWADLAGPDAAKAHRAIWTLAFRPEQAVPFLKARLKPVVAADAATVASLVRDLDSSNFAQRKKASDALAKLGPGAGPALRKAVADTQNLESRRRIEQLLTRMQPDHSGEALRELRSIEALEHCRTAPARLLLESLAKGLPDTRLTEEANQALRRLQDGNSAALD